METFESSQKVKLYKLIQLSCYKPTKTIGHVPESELNINYSALKKNKKPVTWEACNTLSVGI